MIKSLPFMACLAAVIAFSDQPHSSAQSQYASLFQSVISKQWSGGREGQPKSVTFQQFSVGNPYSYRAYDPLSGGSPDGPGGRNGTVVFPVRATFTVRESYSTSFNYTQRTRSFSCFKTVQQYWTCNAAGGGYESKNWSTPR